MVLLLISIIAQEQHFFLPLVSYPSAFSSPPGLGLSGNRKLFEITFRESLALLWQRGVRLARGQLQNRGETVVINSLRRNFRRAARLFRGLLMGR